MSTTEGVHAPLSPTALVSLDRQFKEALDLAVTCGVLSERSRASGDALTAVALDRLSSELGDQAAVLAPLVGLHPPDAVPPCPPPCPSGEVTCLVELDSRLTQVGLVAQSDAMAPGLEGVAAGLLWALAALHHTRREFLLVCTLLDSA
jgi:hypothetical protein